MRAVALDLGSRRIGVAICDSAGTLATPYETLERSGDISADHDAVAAVVDEIGAEIVVVGLPTSLDGSEGPAAIGARSEASALARRLDVAVTMCDERLTTVTAERVLADQGVPARKRRAMVDQVAASVILQSWLDGGSPVDGVDSR